MDTSQYGSKMVLGIGSLGIFINLELVQEYIKKENI